MSELPEAPPGTRVFAREELVGLADAAPSGRARCDAIARWLQDAAWQDVEDAGLADEGAWVARRLALRVDRFPAFGEHVEVRTFCSGTGRLWAERRSSVRGNNGGHVEAIALWVHLDAQGARPRPLPPAFAAVYGPSAAGRSVGARLTHPALPPAGVPRTPWRFRVSDLDVARHVNNAAYWAVIEEELGAAEPAPGFTAAVEHRASGAAGDAVICRDGTLRWVLDGAQTVLASLEATWPA